MINVANAGPGDLGAMIDLRRQQIDAKEAADLAEERLEPLAKKWRRVQKDVAVAATGSMETVLESENATAVLLADKLNDEHDYRFVKKNFTTLDGTVVNLVITDAVESGPDGYPESSSSHWTEITLRDGSTQQELPYRSTTFDQPAAGRFAVYIEIGDELDLAFIVNGTRGDYDYEETVSPTADGYRQIWDKDRQVAGPAETELFAGMLAKFGIELDLPDLEEFRELDAQPSGI